MSNTYDKSKEAFEKRVLPKYLKNKKKLNEATTRLRIIDEIFFECLGWDKTDCLSEDSLDGKFADYSFGKEGKNLIIEAKKEGVYFNLPEGKEGVYKLKSLVDGNKQLKDAITQCLDYCQKRGVPIGAVFNGHQLVAFISSRQDGKPPIEGLALVFSSLGDIQSNFLEFWNNLSKPGVSNYRIFQTLKLNPHTAPEKLSTKIVDYPGFKIRNELQIELQILGGLFLEDINREPELEEEFLKYCYCPSGALSQYSLLSRQILQTKYSNLFQKEIGHAVTAVNTKHGTTKELTADILSASMSRRPIILLGEVGAGKSTFIRHFIKIEAADLLEKAVVLYIDFGKEPALPDKLSDFVIESCKKQLLDNYGIDIEDKNFILGVYDLELKKFRKRSIYSLLNKEKGEISQREVEFLEKRIKNDSEHLRLSLEHISKAQKRQLVLFLDNIDQRPLEFQDQVYLIGHGLAESWPGTIFMSLRPETFFLSKRKGSLAGYQPRVFTISPPRIDLVISKRLEFAIKNLTEGIHLQMDLSDGVSIKSELLADYLRIIHTSFKENLLLIEFVDNVSGCNVRRAIDFLTSFIGSGHVDTKKILDIYKKDKKYLIPLHEFFRAVLYGDNVYYNPEASPIPNLFDISTTDGKEHFLKCIILMHTERIGKGNSEQGYVTSKEIYTFCQDVGYTPEQTKTALSECVKTLLLEASPRFSDIRNNNEEIFRYRITSIGAYMVKKILGQFSYIDAVLVDVPVVSEDYSEKISTTNSINERLDRAMIFCEYLDNEWGKLPTEQIPFSWSNFSVLLKKEISKIRIAISRNQDKGAVSK